MTGTVEARHLWLRAWRSAWPARPWVELGAILESYLTVLLVVSSLVLIAAAGWARQWSYLCVIAGLWILLGMLLRSRHLGRAVVAAFNPRSSKSGFGLASLGLGYAATALVLLSPLMGPATLTGDLAPTIGPQAAAQVAAPAEAYLQAAQRALRRSNDPLAERALDQADTALLAEMNESESAQKATAAARKSLNGAREALRNGRRPEARGLVEQALAHAEDAVREEDATARVGAAIR